MKSSCSSLITALGSAVLVVTVLTAASFGQSGAQQESSANPADDPANDLFIQTCNRCHDAARITALRRTKTEWEEVINKMIERGATGSEEDFMTVFGYLRRHYGKVYINSAPIEEITTTLEKGEKTVLEQAKPKEEAAPAKKDATQKRVKKRVKKRRPVTR